MATDASSHLASRSSANARLKNELAEVFASEDLTELFANRVRIDRHRFAFTGGRVEADVFKQTFEDRVEPASSDVLRRLIHLKSAVGNFLNGVVTEGKLDAFDFQ